MVDGEKLAPLDMAVIDEMIKDENDDYIDIIRMSMPFIFGLDEHLMSSNRNLQASVRLSNIDSIIDILHDHADVKGNIDVNIVDKALVDDLKNAGVSPEYDYANILKRDMRHDEDVKVIEILTNSKIVAKEHGVPLLTVECNSGLARLMTVKQAMEFVNIDDPRTEDAYNVCMKHGLFKEPDEDKKQYIIHAFSNRAIEEACNVVDGYEIPNDVDCNMLAFVTAGYIMFTYIVDDAFEMAWEAMYDNAGSKNSEFIDVVDKMIDDDMLPADPRVTDMLAEYL